MQRNLNLRVALFAKFEIIVSNLLKIIVYCCNKLLDVRVTFRLCKEEKLQHKICVSMQKENENLILNIDNIEI